jgi:hypothetical protein
MIPMIARHSRSSLLVTLALATLGVACKDNGGTTPDGSAGAGGSGGRGGGGGSDAGGSGGGADTRDGRDSATARDTATPDTALPDRPDSGRLDAAPDSAGDAGVNPRQLWFSGPDGDFHLNDFEPEDPF